MITNKEERRQLFCLSYLWSLIVAHYTVFSTSTLIEQIIIFKFCFSIFKIACFQSIFSESDSNMYLSSLKCCAHLHRKVPWASGAPSHCNKSELHYNFWEICPCLAQSFQNLSLINLVKAKWNHLWLIFYQSINWG